jgi:hypothetical protein
MTRNDNLLAGMHRASTAALSCAGAVGVAADIWISEILRNSESWSRRFRLFHHLSVSALGVRINRKQGLKEKSHTSLTMAVCPARNVARHS